MNGLMMDFQLTLPPLLRRAETIFGDQEVVSRLPDRSFHTYTFRDLARRSKQLARRAAQARARARRPRRHALLEPLPAPRGLLRDSRRRLRPAHAQPAPAPRRLAYIANHGGDRALIVDRQPRPTVGAVPRIRRDIEHVFVVEDGFEELLDYERPPTSRRDPELDENEAAARCATRAARPAQPKGVLYSHRSTILHALGVATTSPLGHPRSARRTRSCRSSRCSTPTRGAIPFLCALMARRKSSCPARSSTRRACSSCSRAEKVTWTAGVPTIWLGMLQVLDAKPGKWDLSAMQGDARRRLRGAARADRRVQEAARPRASSRAGA